MKKRCLFNLHTQNGKPMIDSEITKGPQYTIVDEHLVVFAGKDGAMAVHWDKLPEFVEELQGLFEVFGGFKDLSGCEQFIKQNELHGRERRKRA